MSAALKDPTVDMTVDEFLRWDPGDGVMYQLVDGRPVAMAPPGAVHALLQAKLAALIDNHLRARRLDCDVVGPTGVIPRLFAARNMRVPDLGVTCRPVRPGQRSLAEPVLLVEILSPGNRGGTWANVWSYTSIPSVTEILVLHSTRVRAEILRRPADGEWPPEPERADSGDLVLASIDLRVPLNELYARTGLLD